MKKDDSDCQLTIAILTKNERENILQLVPRVRKCAETLKVPYEILVVDGNSSDGTADVARTLQCRVVMQSRKGYSEALKEALLTSRGKWIATLDADLSHDPEILYHLWAMRESAVLLVASRYIDGGRAHVSLLRGMLSRLLNKIYQKVLDLPYHDFTSGYRLMKREIISSMVSYLTGKDFDILPEILIRAYCDGRKVQEVPFTYYPRRSGYSKAKIIKYGLSYLRSLWAMWQIRNSAFSCDYDERAYRSRIPIQRYWQRKRHKIIVGIIRDHRKILDVGCGSSRIIQTLRSAVGLDIDLKKLQYLSGRNPYLVKGTIKNLPFKENLFSTVVCSEVIEHIPKYPVIYHELYRVISKEGWLIIGTPDYSSWMWRVFEWFYGKILPFAYAEQHISHYTGTELIRILQENRFEIIQKHYIMWSELIILAQKRSYGS